MDNNPWYKIYIPTEEDTKNRLIPLKELAKMTIINESISTEGRPPLLQKYVGDSFFCDYIECAEKYMLCFHEGVNYQFQIFDSNDLHYTVLARFCCFNCYDNFKIYLEQEKVENEAWEIFYFMKKNNRIRIEGDNWIYTDEPIYDND